MRAAIPARNFSSHSLKSAGYPAAPQRRSGASGQQHGSAGHGSLVDSLHGWGPVPSRGSAFVAPPARPHRPEPPGSDRSAGSIPPPRCRRCHGRKGLPWGLHSVMVKVGKLSRR